MNERDRLIRDLVWTLRSPPLIVDGADVAIWPDDDWFRNLETTAPDDLPTPPDPHHFRLGQHFEKTLVAWLEATPRFELLASNLQVHEGKRTVGEFDLIVDNDGVVEHWEAAVKFYLGVRDTADMSNWYGPNTADRFDIKYRRLIDRQLRLAWRDSGRETLAERGIGVRRSRCFMKGRLFHPWDRYREGIARYPREVNPHHEQGWWISYADFLEAFDDRGWRYVYLPKRLWLAPLAATTAVWSFWELVEYLESPHAEQATHVAIMNDDGELSRGFVVNDKWLTRINDSIE